MIFWQTFVNRSENKLYSDELLSSIHYQLTTLLNSEAPMRHIPDSFPQAQKSLLGLGLDNSQSLSSQIDNDQFSRSIEKMIKAFEPRLADVSVYVQETAPQKNVVCFSIMAKVETSHGEHVFLFDSNISFSNQVARMEGQEVV